MLYVILDSAMKVLPKRYVPVHNNDYVLILSRLIPNAQTVLKIDIDSFTKFIRDTLHISQLVKSWWEWHQSLPVLHSLKNGQKYLRPLKTEF